jgi:hypothetical protein
MKISMHTMAADSFVPMLESLSAILDKGAARAKGKERDLMDARLAPDMYTLTRQVQLACDYAKDCVSALMGQAPPAFADDEQTIDDPKGRIARAPTRMPSRAPRNATAAFRSRTTW